MLSYLRVQGLALLDDVSIELDPRLNVLTGETGAGKSIIVDALALARGARSRSDWIRSGDDALVVDAQFELQANLQVVLRELLERHGLAETDLTEPVVVRRVSPRSGKGRCFVNGQLATREALLSVGEVLIDICSQHEHHSLAEVGRHLEVLDGFARLDGPLRDYQQTFAEYRSAVNHRERLARRVSGAAQQAEYLAFQIDEIERVSPQPGELEMLKKRLALLRDQHRWATFCAEALEILHESEDSVLTRLSRLLDQASRGAESSPALSCFAEQMATARAASEEALSWLRRFEADLELEPGALEQTEERVHELSRLDRRHPTGLGDLASYLEGLRAELTVLRNIEEELATAETSLTVVREACQAKARVLHEARAQATRRLDESVQAELKALHLPLARFHAQLTPLDRADPGPRGSDKVEFLFSANPGEPPAPLNRVASGGELSRVLLAIRGSLTETGGVATYVFDEVDSGVGGAVAGAIGQRLARAARNHQVLCITHLPQLAAFADAHFRVEKEVRDGRTTTRVLRLNEEQRIDELARMLAGAQITETARQHARQLVEEAQSSNSIQPPSACATRRRRRA